MKMQAGLKKQKMWRYPPPPPPHLHSSNNKKDDNFVLIDCAFIHLFILKVKKVPLIHLMSDVKQGARIVKCQACDQKVAVMEQWVNFQYHFQFHCCITAVVHKRSWSFCQKRGWKVTVKHTGTLWMWPCMKWHDMVHGCIVYTECGKTSAVSHGTSHVTVK